MLIEVRRAVREDKQTLLMNSFVQRHVAQTERDTRDVFV